jgi:hypothetical protein
LGGGIASSLILTSCGKGGDKVVTFTTAIETLEYLEKNSTNCPIEEFNTWIDGPETIVEPDRYTSYINQYITQKVLLNALIYTVAFTFEDIFNNPSSSLDFSTNYVHASCWDAENENFMNIYANLNKFNSFEDFFIVYSSDIFSPSYISSKNHSADVIDIIHNDLGTHPTFWWAIDGG